MKDWKEQITQYIYKQTLEPEYRAIFTNRIIEIVAL